MVFECDKAKNKVDHTQETGDVLDRNGILNRQPMLLTLLSNAINHDARISRQTGKGERDVTVNRADLANRALLLQFLRCLVSNLQNRHFVENLTNLFLNAQHDAVGAADADGGGALFDGFLGVLDLEQVPVRREDGDGAIV